MTWGPVTSVLVADDQELVRHGLRLILDTERPDVVQMDIKMPGLDGIEATRRIVGSLPGTRVVMLTTFDRSQLVYDALLAGASGFMLKDMPGEQLVGGVRAAARGEELLAPSITRRLIEELTPADRRPAPAGYDQLTEREAEVLGLVARGRVQAVVLAYECGLVRPGE